MGATGKLIKAFTALGVVATFAVADVTIEGRALAQGARLMPLQRVRIPARNATLHRSEAALQGAMRYKRATTKAAPPESKATFEVLTGNLKVDAFRTLGGFKITGGEINLYKKMAWLGPGASMVVCFFFKADLKPCIEALIPSAVSKDDKNNKVEVLPLRQAMIARADLTLARPSYWDLQFTPDTSSWYARVSPAPGQDR